ncbi:hypothetical protein AAMO2058_000209600, partial [Amorphochlora amoebiformis]
MDLKLGVSNPLVQNHPRANKSPTGVPGKCIVTYPKITLLSDTDPGMGFLLLSHSNLEAEAPHLEVTLRGLVSKKLLHAINSALLAMQTEWAHLAGLLPRPRLEQGGWRFGTSCSAEFHGEVLLFCFISPLESCDYKAESTNSSIQKSFQKYGNTMIFRAPLGVEGINSSIVGGAAGLVSLHPDASLQV